MRFVRVYTLAASGEVVNVTQQEIPFNHAGISIPGVALDMHDLGLVEDFAPTSVSSGEPCTPSAHLFQRLERDPASGGFRAKAGHELPPIIDCPVTLEGIKQRLRERGPESIPAKARAWLTLMLPPAEVEALGVGRGIPVSALKALDDMRVRRDPGVGSRRVVLERAARKLSDERTAAALKRVP
jgi:hypothetical protein